MNRYTFQELADMHLTYGAAGESCLRARQMYAERYPNRRVPQHQMFSRVHRQLCETGSFAGINVDRGSRRSTRTVSVEEAVLQSIEEQPSSSTRGIARQFGVSQSSVWRILNEERLHPFHLQRVQLLEAEDYPKRVTFCQWFMQRTAVDPNFPTYVLFTDEASFTREGVFNTHNSHVWANQNPHGTTVRAAQQRFAVNVWTGIVGDCLLGPYLLPSRLDCANYLIFLQTVLPGLMNEVPAVILRRMWFQHDGAPAHFANDVRCYLTRKFGAQWIGRGGPVCWPPRSPDLSPIDFFVWGAMKNMVYETPVASAMDLVARISVAAANIRETPGIFQKVRLSMQRRCEACNLANGQNFEHLL